jgi:NADPH:quinone reductase-like Zn-dependent oxidoreductase
MPRATGASDNPSMQLTMRLTVKGEATDGPRLAEIAKLIDEGKLHPLIQVVLPLERVKEALELSRGRHAAGKIVLTI